MSRVMCRIRVAEERDARPHAVTPNPPFHGVTPIRHLHGSAQTRDSTSGESGSYLGLENQVSPFSSVRHVIGGLTRTSSEVVGSSPDSSLPHSRIEPMMLSARLIADIPTDISIISSLGISSALFLCQHFQKHQVCRLIRTGARREEQRQSRPGWARTTVAAQGWPGYERLGQD
jgi:hypothetical protein